MASGEGHPDSEDRAMIRRFGSFAERDCLDALEKVEAELDAQAERLRQAEAERDAAVERGRVMYELLWSMVYYGSFHVGRDHEGAFVVCENAICAGFSREIMALEKHEVADAG